MATKGKKRVVSKLVPVEEAESSKQGDKQAEGLKAMNDDDVAEYLKAVATGKITAKGLESTISDQLKNSAQRRMEIEQRIAQLRRELDQLAKEAIRIQGEVDAHTRLLVFAEDARRAKKGDKP